ncbi:hypothetical protein MGN70_006426 [Eutypa lata]|nr:hypothetical protein MGN70_006426 [Eutypa lata]
MTDYSELEVPDHVSYQDETYDHGSRDDNNGQLDGREGSGASARPWTPITVLSPDMSDEDEQDALAYLIDDEDSDDTIVVNDEASYLGSSDDTTVGSRSSDETIIASPGFIRLPDYGGYPLFRLSSRGGSPSSSMICEGSSDSDDGVIMGSIGRVADYDDDDDDDDYHQSEPLIPGDCSPKFTAEDPLPPIGYPELYANEYFQIQDSHLSGLGAFSVRDIEQGTVILTEKALFHATERNLYDVLEQLHPDYQASFNRLHAYYQSPRIDRKTAIFRTNG